MPDTARPNTTIQAYKDMLQLALPNPRRSRSLKIQKAVSYKLLAVGRPEVICVCECAHDHGHIASGFCPLVLSTAARVWDKNSRIVSAPGARKRLVFQCGTRLKLDKNCNSVHRNRVCVFEDKICIGMSEDALVIRWGLTERHFASLDSSPAIPQCTHLAPRDDSARGASGLH
jgi:hypothetical protein